MKLLGIELIASWNEKAGHCSAFMLDFVGPKV
jgi:hypothetical protein